MTDRLRTFTVVGLDPSLSNFGAVKIELTLNLSDNAKVESFKYLTMGLSETVPDKSKGRRKNEEDLARAKLHKDFLKDILKDTDFVFIEMPVGSQTARAMASYGICIGLCAWIEVPIFILSPAELKMAACGTKTASKAEMTSWATKALPDADWMYHSSTGKPLAKNEHTADALAAIVAGIQSTTFKKSMLFI
jgi:Holliday junction resolvasome RuvABC endonuclease subunit